MVPMVPMVFNSYVQRSRDPTKQASFVLSTTGISNLIGRNDVVFSFVTILAYNGCTTCLLLLQYLRKDTIAKAVELKV